MHGYFQCSRNTCAMRAVGSCSTALARPTFILSHPFGPAAEFGIACATHEPCEDACAPTARNQSAGETRLRLAHERQPSRSSASQHRQPTIQGCGALCHTSHMIRQITDNRAEQPLDRLLPFGLPTLEEGDGTTFCESVSLFLPPPATFGSCEYWQQH